MLNIKQLFIKLDKMTSYYIHNLTAFIKDDFSNNVYIYELINRKKNKIIYLVEEEDADIFPGFSVITEDNKIKYLFNLLINNGCGITTDGERYMLVAQKYNEKNALKVIVYHETNPIGTKYDGKISAFPVRTYEDVFKKLICIPNENV